MDDGWMVWWFDGKERRTEATSKVVWWCFQTNKQNHEMTGVCNTGPTLFPGWWLGNERVCVFRITAPPHGSPHSQWNKNSDEQQHSLETNSIEVHSLKTTTQQLQTLQLSYQHHYLLFFSSNIQKSQMALAAYKHGTHILSKDIFTKIWIIWLILEHLHDSHNVSDSCGLRGWGLHYVLF